MYFSIHCALAEEEKWIFLWFSVSCVISKSVIEAEEKSFHSRVANIVNFNIIVSEFELQSCYLLWSRGGSNDNTTCKWVIRNILKENSRYINDSWAKPHLSLTQSGILPFLVTVYWDCAEESFASICHMRASPSVGKTSQHYYIHF